MRDTNRLPWEEEPVGAAPPPPPVAMKRAPKRMARKRKKPTTDKEVTIAALVEVATAAIWLYRKVAPLIKELKQKKGKNERKSKN